MLDLINAIVFACNKRWFNIETFDAEEYKRMTCYTSGDLNWIIPGEVIAFSGPVDQQIGNSLIICMFIE